MKFIQLVATSAFYLIFSTQTATADYLKAQSCDYLDDQCGGNKYCQAAPGDCLLKMATIPGKCQLPPEMCTMNMDPVCGCDGKTYANECSAYAEGVSVARKGECPNNGCQGENGRPCTCRNGFICTEDEDCSDSSGGCAYRPPTSDRNGRMSCRNGEDCFDQNTACADGSKCKERNGIISFA